MRGDALHRFFDAGNLRTVLEQDVSCLRSDGERFGVTFFQQGFRTIGFFGHMIVKWIKRGFLLQR